MRPSLWRRLRQRLGALWHSERAIVVTLALLSGARVFVGATMLPIFTLVDEHEHYDLTAKYARGHWPDADSNHYDYDTSRLTMLYGSPEYLTPNEVLRARPAKPLWKFDASVRDSMVEEGARKMAGRVNYEAHSPPVYYVLAGVWNNLGAVLGQRDAILIYWTRFLNVLLYPLFVLLSYHFIGRFYPQERSLRINATILLASFPQDVFFSMNNDVLSPLLFLGALYLLLLWRNQDGPATWLGIASGLMVAMTFLVKYSNIAIVLVAAMIFGRKLVHAARAGRLRQRQRELLLAALASAIPVLCWLGRNLFVLNDLTGSHSKIAELGWTYKPLSELGDHPMFTPMGFVYFFSTLIRNFWIGEIIWHFERVTPAVYEWFFILSTFLCLIAAAVRCWRQARIADRGRDPDGLLFLAVSSSVFFLVLISLLFDFGDCFYPSREAPYFVSGRLIIGVLCPFVILFVRGLEFLLARWPDLAKRIAVVSIALISLACQFGLFATVYASEFNWFHLQ